MRVADDASSYRCSLTVKAIAARVVVERVELAAQRQPPQRADAVAQLPARKRVGERLAYRFAEFGDWQPLDLSDEYWPEDPPLLGAHGVT